MLTSWANGIGVFIFGAEDGHLHHAQENHPCYPELDPQQILPVAGRPDEPEQAIQDVHDAHHHVELQTDSTRFVSKDCLNNGSSTIFFKSFNTVNYVINI